MDTMTTMSDMNMGMAVISVRPDKPRKATAEARCIVGGHLKLVITAPV
jgi:hypothetical protein